MKNSASEGAGHDGQFARSGEPSSAPGRRPSLQKAAIALSAGGLIGKVAGIARELLLAAGFGTTSVTVAYRLAQTATAIPLNLLTSDSLNSGFLPVHARLQVASPQDAESFYRTLQRVLLMITVCVAAIVFALAPWISVVLAPGLSPDVLRMTTQMIRVMVLGMPLFVSGATSSYLGLALGHYRLVSLRSTIQNLGLIGGVAAAWATDRWIFIAWGFTGGCAAYSLSALLYSQKHRLVRGEWRWPGWPEARRVLRPFSTVIRGLLLLPVIVQLNEVIERVVASLVSARTVAATEFANFVVDTCITLVAVPLGLAGLASLSRPEDADRRAAALTPVLLLVGLPVSVILGLHAPGLVTLLYKRGKFDASSATTTAVLVEGFAAGLWAQLLAYVYTKVYSGTLQIRRLVITIAVGMTAGMMTMLIAIPTHDALWIGLAGSVYGLVVTIVAGRQMGVLRILSLWLARLAPGCLIAIAIAAVLPGASAGATVLSCALSVVAWMAYCMALPPSRHLIRRSFARADD